MFIVTRTFRDANGVFGAGSIVDPASVRTFTSRFQQNHIVEVNETNVDEWDEFFKNRYKIDLAEKLDEYIKFGKKTELPEELQPIDVPEIKDNE